MIHFLVPLSVSVLGDFAPANALDRLIQEFNDVCVVTRMKTKAVKAAIKSSSFGYREATPAKYPWDMKWESPEARVRFQAPYEMNNNGLRPNCNVGLRVPDYIDRDRVNALVMPYLRAIANNEIKITYRDGFAKLQWDLNKREIIRFSSANIVDSRGRYLELFLQRLDATKHDARSHIDLSSKARQ